jgi:Protein of unknown function DUF262
MMKSSATATNRKISWFNREDSAGTLDLSPEFQRRPVWTEEQASYLIDTILNGLPFPEVYMRARTTPDGKTTYEVVDGQQRIRSILDFSRNDLTLIGKDVSPTLVGKTFTDLPDNLRTAFWSYDVVTRELYDASDGDIRDLFRRLNISAVTLNDQELRHARYTGVFKNLMEDLADDEWWTDMRVVNVRQVRRMEDVEYISELFVSLMAGPQNKKSTLEGYYVDYDKDFPDKDRLADLFRHTRDLLASTLSTAEIRAWSGKSDFYSLFSAFAACAESRRRFSTTQKAAIKRALMRFREQVSQAKRKDNTQVFSRTVASYADAVSRAASDITRRKLRQEILTNLIERALSKHASD